MDVMIQDGSAEPGENVSVMLDGFENGCLTGKKLN